MKRKLWTTIALLLVIAAASGAWYLWLRPAPEPETEAPALQTAKVRTGNILVSALGIGSLSPARVSELGFGSGGTVVEVNAQVGDAVTAGDVIARISDATAQRQVALAELSLEQAQIKLDEADVAIALAESSVAEAQLKLEELTEEPNERELLSAKANLEAAQADLAMLLAGPSAEDLRIAEADLEKARLAVEKAQAAYDAIAWKAGVSGTPQAAALEQATIDYEKALATYEQRMAGATAAQIATAQAKIATAEQAYEKLLEGSPYDVRAAEINLAQAQAQLDAARQTRALEIAVEQAELNLAAAQQDLEETVLRAPFDGVITELELGLGESVGTASVVTIADLATLWVNLYIDETDMDKLAVGNEVEVIFDALPDTTFSGSIVQIDPLLTSVDGVPVFQAAAELAGPKDTLATLVPGMNASVEVIAGRAEDVLLVPVEALRDLGDGNYAVFKLVEGEPKLTPVQIGLQDYTYAEVLAGLQKNDTVTTGIVPTE